MVVVVVVVVVAVEVSLVFAAVVMNIVTECVVFS